MAEHFNLRKRNAEAMARRCLDFEYREKGNERNAEAMARWHLDPGYRKQGNERNAEATARRLLGSE